MSSKTCPRGTRKVGGKCVPKKGIEVRFLMKKGHNNYEEIFPIDSKGHAVNIGAKNLNDAVRTFKRLLDEMHKPYGKRGDITINLDEHAIGRRKVYAINWDKTKEIKIW